MGRLIRNRWAAAGLAAALGALAAWWGIFVRVEPGMVRYNPNVQLQPETSYFLEYWDYRWPTAPDGSEFEPWLQAALADFNRQHPNIRVSYRLLDRENGREVLDGALRAGKPPDVYAPLPGAGVFYDERLQVPVDLYLTEEERGSAETEPLYLPAALEAVRFRDRVMAWPRWLAVHVWLGNGAALEASGIDGDTLAAGGLDRAALADALAGRPSSLVGMAVNPPGAEVLVDLMHAAGASGFLSGEGERQWRRETVEAAALWLEELRHNEIIPTISTATADLMVDQVFEGRAAVLAGANPWLVARLSNLVRGAAEDGDAGSGTKKGLVFLPPPDPAGEEGGGLRTSPANLIVFRQAEYKGHEQTKAAMELARFLSRRGHPWALPDAPAFPAYRPALAEWTAASRGEGRLLSALTDTLRPVPPRTDAVAREEERLMSEEVSPAMADFWAGELDAAGLAARLGVEEAPVEEAPRPFWQPFLDRVGGLLPGRGE